MSVGSGELARAGTAYTVCLAFALTFLLATYYGNGPLTAVIRGTVVAIIARIMAPLLIQSVIGTVLDAMARDQSVTNTPNPEEKSN